MPTLIERLEAFVQIAIDAETCDCWGCEGRKHVLGDPVFTSGPKGVSRTTPVVDCTRCGGSGIDVPTRLENRVTVPVFISAIPQLLMLQQQGDLGSLEIVLVWLTRYAQEIQADAFKKLADQGLTGEDALQAVVDATTRAREHREGAREPAGPGVGALTAEEIDELIGDASDES